MDAVKGITIERYAELCAKMKDVMRDKEACAKIAISEGIRRSDWEAAHKEWQYRMTDPSDMGKTASAFEPAWQAALRSGKSPDGFS